jgi:RsiW-degrading membrane proteinase PrsW (M82 family)
MPDLHSLLRPPYIYLILGAISFSGAVVSTCTGKSWGRFGGFVYRAEEPNQFWWLVAVYFLGGVLFIGIFMYDVSGLSH